MDNFKIEWQVEDGYVCGRRPQTVTINVDDIDNGMEEDDLLDLYNSLIDEDFSQKVCAQGQNEDEFLAWAKGVIESRDNASSGETT